MAHMKLISNFKLSQIFKRIAEQNSYFSKNKILELMSLSLILFFNLSGSTPQILMTNCLKRN